MRFPLLNWMTRRAPRPYSLRDAPVETESPPGRAMSGKYLLLYKYLENRYANRVVLTFAEIEDLIGSALPDQARSEPEWWTIALSSRTAQPNLLAQTVAFVRPF